MHLVIFDTCHDLALRAAGFLSQSEVLQIALYFYAQLRIAKGTGVLHFDIGLVPGLYCT